jgi:hypothetical protein
MIKAEFENPTVNIILNCERLKIFSSKMRNKAKIPVLPLLFNIVLEVLARAIGQIKNKK